LEQIVELAPGLDSATGSQRMYRSADNDAGEAIKQYGAPRFCKIDVEAYEFEVLRGLSRRIEILTFEYQLTEGGIKKTFDCITYLSNFGTLSMNLTRGIENKLWWPD
jgi:hypothetical protein